MSRPVDFLLDYLEAERARGVTHVLLDEGARDGLRALHERCRTAAAGPAVIRAPDPVAVSAELKTEGTTRAEQIESLKRQAESWVPSRALGSLRETLVFSTGDPEARVMLIGEAPGYQEERAREPFTGPAGQKLNDILKAMGISRDSVYLTNIVKFRPAMPRQTTNNRKPTAEEMAVWMPFVRAEIDIVRPECVIALGSTAAEGLLGIPGAVGEMRGKWHGISGTPVRVTHHPGHLLQTSGATDIKRLLWEDMLAVMEKLGMPVSDRQRGFFLPKP